MADTDPFTSAPLSHGTSYSSRPADSSGDAGGRKALLSDATEMGAELIAAVRDGVVSLLDEQRTRAAGEIAAVGEVLTRSGESLDRTRHSAIGRYAEEAGREVTRFADRVRNRPYGMLAADLEDFARRWPLAFMAGAIGAGLLVGRFLVSSAAQPAQQTALATPVPSVGGEPHGGARYDHGSVSGGVSGSANSGYGASGGSTSSGEIG